MSEHATIDRRWGNAFQLNDLLDAQETDRSTAERDFALVTIAAKLAQDHGTALVFKGGFVLRHVYGHARFSKDIDATRHDPPEAQLDPAAIAESIESARIGKQIRFDVPAPARSTPRSLDFEHVTFTGEMLSRGDVQVEISYREGVVLDPRVAKIGLPFYKPFPLLCLQPEEIVAEKMRTLAQRVRPSDLLDVAMLIASTGDEMDRRVIADVAARKFELVAGTRARRLRKIQENVVAIGASYADAAIDVGADDHAPSYEEAVDIVDHWIRPLVP